MKAATRVLSASAAAILMAGATMIGQEAPKGPTASTSDPRYTLKPGLRDAGEAIKNLERLSALSKPAGFFDPNSPAGGIIPPEKPGEENAPPPPPDAPPPPQMVALMNALNFSNSDLAFQGNHLIQGNFHGFTAYDIENGKNPKLLASVVCPGGQGDVSVHGNLLFMSVEQTLGRIDCGSQGVSETVSAERFRGIRIFDISDLSKPKQVAAVQTCRGSHTHTLVTSITDKENLYVYGSGTGMPRAGEELEGCSNKDPKDDPNTSLFSIDVIQVPLKTPQNAKIVNRPRIFADEKTGNVRGLWQGGNFGPGTQSSRETNQCHDITVYPEIGLAAGACAGNGILLDIKDPVHPKRLDAVTDKNFAYWHSATFNNDGTKVLFTDEWGGGARPRCRPTDLMNWGADAIFDIVREGNDVKMVFKGYYKLPAAQTDQENCVAHNGSLIPVPGRDIMVQAWYQGGLSVFDFTDSANAKEIAYFDRGPIDAKNLVLGGYWSAYWYNGHIYGSEIARGVDVFRLKPSEFLSQNEIDAATLVRNEELNTQEQMRIKWPAATPIALAYVDQLNRGKAIKPERARAVKSALEHADGLRSGQDKNAAAVLAQLDAVAAQVDGDAAAAGPRDAERFTALAATIRGRAAKLR